MLSENEFVVWCSKNNISDVTAKIIDYIRKSPPSRSTGGGKRSVQGKYPSNKMGVTIQFESHTVELPAIYQKEFDPSVLEYYDQPFPIKLNYASRNGRNIGVMHTPDFFVISKASAYWEEWKTEKELIELSQNSPNRYTKDYNGVWRCPPGEEYARRYGLNYKLRSSSEIEWILYRNIRFLEDYYTDKYSIVSEEIKEEIKRIIEQNPGITLSALINNSASYSADDIYLLLTKNEIYTDIRTFALSSPESVPLFISKDHAYAMAYIEKHRNQEKNNVDIIELMVGARLEWDGNS